MIHKLFQFFGFGRQPKLKYLALIHKVLEQGFNPKIESYGSIEIIRFSEGIIDCLVSYNREFSTIHASFIHSKSQLSVGQYEKKFASPNPVWLLEWWYTIVLGASSKLDTINYLERSLELQSHENENTGR